MAGIASGDGGYLKSGGSLGYESSRVGQLSLCQSVDWFVPGIVAGIKKRGVLSDKIAMLPNGCDLDIFTEDAKPWRPESVASSDLMAVLLAHTELPTGLMLFWMRQRS